MVLGVLERKPDVRRIKINTLSADKNMAQLAANIIDKCKYIHPSRVEEVEQLLIKLRKHAMANERQVDDSSAGGSTDRIRENKDRDRDREERDRKRSNDAAPNRQGIAQNNGREDHRSSASAPAPRPVVDPLPPAYMNNLDDYLEMLYQVSGKSEKEREEGLKLQVG